MNDGELARRLQAVVANRIGKPGIVHGALPLTGGANRSTLAFDAEIDSRRVPLIVQLGVQTPDPVAGITPELRPSEAGSSDDRRRRDRRARAAGPRDPRTVGRARRGLPTGLDSRSA
jgi:hypothetical protein